MDFRDISSYIDMLIGLLEQAILSAFTAHLKALMDLFNSLMAGYSNDDPLRFSKLEQFKRDAEQLNRQHYSDVQRLIEQAKVLSYIHTKTPSEFLLSVLSSDDIKSVIGNYEELLKHLDSEVPEYQLSQTINNHIYKLTDELNGIITNNALGDVDIKQSRQAIEHVSDKYRHHAQVLGDFEAGKAQSQAYIDIEDELQDKYRIRKTWISQRDGSVRPTHVALDGKKADKDGYFHSKPTQTKGKAPRKMVGLFAMKENARCRCSIGFTINGVELQQMDKDNMSAEHKAIYERTKFDRYQKWLDSVSENIHPAYYEQLSEGIVWNNKRAKETKRRTVKDDAEKFKDMLERGFHKKKDGSWGY